MWKNVFLLGIVLTVPLFFIALFVSSAVAKKRGRSSITPSATPPTPGKPSAQASTGSRSADKSA